MNLPAEPSEDSTPLNDSPSASSRSARHKLTAVTLGLSVSTEPSAKPVDERSSSVAKTGSYDGSISDVRTFVLPTVGFIPLYGYPPTNFLTTASGWTEILSGITVSLAQLPEAIAWPLLARVDVSIGLSASWLMAIVTSLFGGRPAMISGATGSTAVLMVSLVSDNKAMGPGYLFYAVIFSGIIQIICYFLNAGKVLRLISKSVVIGFVNGLGLIIFFSQFESFKCSARDYANDKDTFCAGDPHKASSHNIFSSLAHGKWLEGKMIACMFGLAFITMITTLLIPKWSKRLPAALIGIILATVVEHAIFRPTGLDTKTVGDQGEVLARFPIPIWIDHSQYRDPTNASIIPSLSDSSVWGQILPTAVFIALVGTVESLLTAQLIDEKTNTKSSPTQEFLGQGLGNLLSGMTGGMGGCAMIGQSMVNIESGARTRVSSLVAGVVTFGILMGSQILDYIPIAALVGVMFVVVWRTIEWESFAVILLSCLPLRAREWYRSSCLPGSKVSRKIHRGDVLVIVAVAAVTLWKDLGIGVAVGVLLTTIFFSWDAGDSLQISRKEVEIDNYDMKREDDTSTGPSLVKTYELEGPLCFSSVPKFLEFFEDLDKDPEYVELHFHQAHLFGYSAIDAINKLGDKFEAHKKQLVIRKVRHLNQRHLVKARDLHGTGFLLREEVTQVWDPVAKKPDHHHELHCSHVPMIQMPSTESQKRRKENAELTSPRMETDQLRSPNPDAEDTSPRRRTFRTSENMV